MEVLKMLGRSVKTVSRGIGEGLVQSLSMLAALVSARVSGVRLRRMRLVESLALGGRRQLLLVVCDEQEYLVGVGAESVETIVPRQPVAEVQQAGTGQGVPAQAVAARHRMGAAKLIGQMGPEHRPWLVKPGVKGYAESRIREDSSSKGRELWQ